ncbi:MAG TPA: hypothetical protein VIW92_09955 [Thermoanaerobaculia bacterium]
MSSELSLSQILANMEAQIESFRKREAFHAEQEVFHREQRAAMAAELAAVLQSYEALKAVAGTAAEIASRTASAAPPPPQEEILTSTVRSKLVGRVVARRPAGEVFSATEISAEVNRRYGRHLRQPANPRMVATALRRLADEGEVRLVQKGTPHHEGLTEGGRERRPGVVRARPRDHLFAFRHPLASASSSVQNHRSPFQDSMTVSS